MPEQKYDCPNPACPNPVQHFAVNTDTLLGHCFVCELGMGPQKVQQFLAGATLAVRQGSRGIRTTPRLIPAWGDYDARKYLESRGVTAFEASQILYSGLEKKLYFPIWSPSPEFSPSWHTRGIGPGGAWCSHPGTHRSHYVYGTPVTNRAVICEGIWESLRIGPGAIAILGSSLSDTHLAYFSQYPNLLSWADPDYAGRKLDTSVLLHFKQAIVVGHSKEAGDCEREDPVLLRVQEFLRADHS